MIALSQRQADEASALCDRMLATIAKLQADFAAMKVAADKFAADLEASLAARSTDHAKGLT
jgi:hypothetical protein